MINFRATQHSRQRSIAWSFNPPCRRTGTYRDLDVRVVRTYGDGVKEVAWTSEGRQLVRSIEECGRRWWVGVLRTSMCSQKSTWRRYPELHEPLRRSLYTYNRGIASIRITFLLSVAFVFTVYIYFLLSLGASRKQDTKYVEKLCIFAKDLQGGKSFKNKNKLINNEKNKHSKRLFFLFVIIVIKSCTPVQVRYFAQKRRDDENITLSRYILTSG